jgi:hypothetical protein
MASHAKVSSTAGLNYTSNTVPTIELKKNGHHVRRKCILANHGSVDAKGVAVEVPERRDYRIAGG